MSNVDLKERLAVYGSGMLCDRQFAATVVDDMLEIFSNEDLQDPDVEFDVNYDGRFSIHVTDSVDRTKAGIEFTVNPVISIDDEYQTVDSLVCGSCVITYVEWEQWLSRQRTNERTEYRQPDCDTTVVYLTRQDGMFTVGVSVIKPQADARTIELELVTQMFESGDDAYMWYDSLIRAVSHLYSEVENEATVS